jgi:hypothetical protein
MTIDLRRSFALVASGCLFAASAAAEPVLGTTGSAAGDDWQSSWLDIDPTTSLSLALGLSPLSV